MALTFWWKSRAGEAWGEPTFLQLLDQCILDLGGACRLCLHRAVTRLGHGDWELQKPQKPAMNSMVLPVKPVIDSSPTTSVQVQKPTVCVLTGHGIYSVGRAAFPHWLWVPGTQSLCRGRSVVRQLGAPALDPYKKSTCLCPPFSALVNILV